MRIAVISDIHGDLDSLRHVLTAIDRAATDQIWCLGDIVGLGATAPAEVVDLVRDRCALALAGKHDRWVTGQLSLSMLPLPRQRAQLQSQHRVLSNEQLTWLAALPAQGRAHDIELWHGSSQDPITGWISNPQDAADHLARQQARDRARRAHPPTVDRREQRHDERLRRAPRQPRPRRRPLRSAQPRRTAPITQMARPRPRSGKRDLAHSLTGRSIPAPLETQSRAAPCSDIGSQMVGWGPLAVLSGAGTAIAALVVEGRRELPVPRRPSG